MKTITKYQAEDGREFFHAEECAKYETLCNRIKEIMNQLDSKPIDDGCAFANGSGYLQHHPSIFEKVKLELLQIANQLCPHQWITQSIKEPLTIHSSYAARIIGESDNNPLNGAWYRIVCTDDKCREWGQPYYTTHPEEAKQIRLNP